MFLYDMNYAEKHGFTTVNVALLACVFNTPDTSRFMSNSDDLCAPVGKLSCFTNGTIYTIIDMLCQ